MIGVGVVNRRAASVERVPPPLAPAPLTNSVISGRREVCASSYTSET